MSDEFEPQATDEVPLADDPVAGVAPPGSDADVAGALPSLDDINLKNAKKAAEWAWDHTLGDHKRQRAPEPIPIVVDIPSEPEETTLRSSSVAHDDPPPPDPDDQRPPHETEYRDW